MLVVVERVIMIKTVTQPIVKVQDFSILARAKLEMDGILRSQPDD